MLCAGLRAVKFAVFFFVLVYLRQHFAVLKNGKEMKSLFTDVTRWQHFWYAIPIGMIFTILCVLGVASGLEFKDKEYGMEWDWKDWSCTMLGGMVGQVVQLLIVWLLWR